MPSSFFGANLHSFFFFTKSFYSVNDDFHLCSEKGARHYDCQMNNCLVSWFSSPPVFNDYFFQVLFMILKLDQNSNEKTVQRQCSTKSWMRKQKWLATTYFPKNLEHGWKRDKLQMLRTQVEKVERLKSFCLQFVRCEGRLSADVKDGKIGNGNTCGFFQLIRN